MASRSSVARSVAARRGPPHGAILEVVRHALVAVGTDGDRDVRVGPVPGEAADPAGDGDDGNEDQRHREREGERIAAYHPACDGEPVGPGCTFDEKQTGRADAGGEDDHRGQHGNADQVTVNACRQRQRDEEPRP